MCASAAFVETSLVEGHRQALAGAKAERVLDRERVHRDAVGKSQLGEPGILIGGEQRPADEGAGGDREPVLRTEDL